MKRPHDTIVYRRIRSKKTRAYYKIFKHIHDSITIIHDLCSTWLFFALKIYSSLRLLVMCDYWWKMKLVILKNLIITNITIHQYHHCQVTTITIVIVLISACPPSGRSIRGNFLPLFFLASTSFRRFLL